MVGYLLPVRGSKSGRQVGGQLQPCTSLWNTEYQEQTDSLVCRNERLGCSFFEQRHFAACEVVTNDCK